MAIFAMKPLNIMFQRIGSGACQKRSSKALASTVNTIRQSAPVAG